MATDPHHGERTAGFTMPEVIGYEQVLQELGEGKPKTLLLGNGFSIALDNRFAYGSLLDIARGNGLSSRIDEVFMYLGVFDFEAVMRFLEHTHWVALHYGVIPGQGSVSPFQTDLQELQRILIQTITQRHPGNVGEVTTARRDRCAGFLTPYTSIFTLNYDLLLYWVEMRRHESGFECCDGFESSVFTGNYRYPDHQYFFLHGALHLYGFEGVVLKHQWKAGRSLISRITESIEKGEYPLIVTEGLSKKKLQRIRSNDYLNCCLEELKRVEGPVVAFGFDFGSGDEHVMEALADSGMTHLYVSVHGNPASSGNTLMMARVAKLKEAWDHRNFSYFEEVHLGVTYFDAASVGVWDPPSSGTAT